MGYWVYDLARQGTTVDLFGPDAFSIENGKKDGVYHLRHFESSNGSIKSSDSHTTSFYLSDFIPNNFPTSPF